MKTRLWTAAALLLTAPILCQASQAQETPGESGRIATGSDVKHDTSPPLTELAAPGLLPTMGLNVEIPIGVRPGTLDRTGPERQPDGAPAQLEAGPSLTPAVDLSFSGLSDDDNAVTVGSRIVPPDTNGDIGFDGDGDKIYIQYVNLIWEIFDATTGASIAGPTAGNTFWSGFGGACETNNDGDPLVLYDDQAGQWVFAQFTDTGLICFAISQTSDPLGSYHRYAFQIADVGGLADYPKIGVWAQEDAPDEGVALNQSAYTLMTRNFPFDPSGFTHSVLLERDQMLAGGTAQFVSFPHGCSGGDCVEGQLPAHQAGAPPAFGTCPTFFTLVDDGYDDSPHGADGVRLHRTCVDWQNTANSTISESFASSASGFDRLLGNGFSACISPVPSPGEALDCLTLFSMYRAQYRFFDGSDGNGTHASVVLNTTVDVGSERAGIHWMELRSADGETSWSIFQEGTYAPDTRERWMGSIAQDGERNIALGYSSVSSSQLPALHYTTRAFSDAAGTLGTEVLCHQGTGVQTSSNNRWGDYSSMSVDPEDDCTFWFTSEYYETTGSFDFNTRICSFKMCNVAPSATISSPADGAVFDDTTSISFAGSASDTEDGDLTSGLAWTSSLDGSIGAGGAFSTTLTAGPHTIEAAVTDSGGETATDQISLTITSAGCPEDLDVGPLTVSDLQTRRAVNTIAVLAGVTVVDTGRLELIASQAITFENGLAIEGNGSLAVETSNDPCN